MFRIFAGDESNDQATAESYWTPGHIQSVSEEDLTPYAQPENAFPSAHGLVQTHPATFSGFGSKPSLWILPNVGEYHTTLYVTRLPWTHRLALGDVRAGRRAMHIAIFFQYPTPGGWHALNRLNYILYRL
jgi:hypothetical protein